MAFLLMLLAMHDAGLSGTNISPGIYLLTVTAIDNKKLTSRFVIE